jgi:DNA-binding MarR family transcriptional regulator
MTSRARKAGPTADDALLDALVQTAYAVVGTVTAVAARHELSLTLLRVGAILRDRTPTMSELAAHLGLDRSTITGLVDRAVHRGILRRVDDERDRRSSRVALTEAGRALAATCGDEIASELRPLVARLAPAERDRLTRLLVALGVSG